MNRFNKIMLLALSKSYVKRNISCQVKIAQGVLQGKECTTFFGKKFYSFEGIPYAKPPVGKLRFRPPAEPENWTGILDATTPGYKCSQIIPYGKTSIEGSEDCLYLNVYTPTLPQDKIEKLPVIFFVHGGRLINGCGHSYKPDYLLRNDVILVTINYRLHILGFLCLNIPEVPGNAALKDSIMALRWLKKNIENFNGDPNNVTVMGESAGAALVGSYITSKMADGLFHKLICQSGVSMLDVYVIEEEDPIDKARLVASNLGRQLTDERRLYEFLVNVPIQDLLIAYNMAEINKPPSVVNPFFMPVTEKKFDNVERFFDENPRKDMISNKFKHVPCIFGLNSHEGAYFIQIDSEGNIIFEKDFFYFIPRYTHVKRADKRAVEFDKKLRRFYFGDQDVNNASKVDYVDLLSDRYLNYDAMQTVEILSKGPSNVYFYKFEYNGNLNSGIMKRLDIKGASHGDIIQYQFYKEGKHEKATDKDLRIVEMLSDAWCSFAKNGTPSWTNQGTKWLPYKPENKHTLLINDDVQLVKNPDFHRFKFWQNLIGDTSKL